MDIEVEGAVTEQRLRRHSTLRQRAASASSGAGGGDKGGEGKVVDVDIGSFRDAAVDCVAGCISGCAGIVVGQVSSIRNARMTAREISRYCSVTDSSG